MEDADLGPLDPLTALLNPGNRCGHPVVEQRYDLWR